MLRATGYLLVLASLVSGFAGAGAADPLPPPLPPPAGEVLLTVTGTVPLTNAEGAALFDLDMLRALPQASIRTTTPWTATAQEFRGVPLFDLLARIGVQEGVLTAHAINDFISTLPLADSRNRQAIIAYEIDGAEIPIRSKGPLWLMYPFDSESSLRTEVIFARSIWQLDRFELGPVGTGDGG